MEENNKVQEETVATSAAPAEGKGMAVASLVLGIVCVALMCFWYLALPSGIVGLILGIVAKKKGQKGMATAGVVLSIIGLAIMVVVVILAAIGVAALNNSISSYY